MNAVVIDVALGAKQRGMPVIAVVSFDHSGKSASRHSSGQKLIELADIAIDNCTPAGDAMVSIDGSLLSPRTSAASGLDSMVIGESEIQGQVKRAYELALVEGATGPISNRLFREALAAGKQVRHETRLGGGRSVAAVAVEAAQSALGDLADRRVLVIGAGTQGELTAAALSRRGVATVFIANRHCVGWGS